MRTIRACWLGVLVTIVSGCDIRFTFPSVTNTNTNTTGITIDSHDVFNFNPTFPLPGTTTPNPVSPTEPDTPLPLPPDAQAIATTVAAARSADLARSCQDRDGLAAWMFMDAIVSALAARDPRWGYLCKRGDCTDISRDVIAYRATADTIGAWAVDIIVNHCPIAPDRSTFAWNVLGFDPAAVWRALRQ